MPPCLPRTHEARFARRGLASQEREQAAIRQAGMGTHALKGDRGYQEDRVIAVTLRGTAALSIGREPARLSF